MSYQFHFYPTLLNQFRSFQLHDSEARFQKLMDRINRVPEKDPEVLKKFRRGYSFEDAVLKNKASEFKTSVIIKAQKTLPKSYKTQQFVQCYFDNIRFYGYADVVGDQKVIDLKSTALYKPGRHEFNAQNLYLYALKEYGFTQMQYIICDGHEVYCESYDLHNYNFEPLLSLISSFKEFLLEHRKLITDQKVIRPIAPSLFD